MLKKKYDNLFKKMYTYATKKKNLYTFIKFWRWFTCKFFLEELFNIYYIYSWSTLMNHAFNWQISAYKPSWLTFEFSVVLEKLPPSESIEFNLIVLWSYYLFSSEYTWFNYRLLHIKNLNYLINFKFNTIYVIRTPILKVIKPRTLKFFFEKFFFSKLIFNSFHRFTKRFWLQLRQKYFLLKSKNMLIKMWINKKGNYFDREFLPAIKKNFIEKYLYFCVKFWKKYKYFFQSYNLTSLKNWLQFFFNKNYFKPQKIIFVEKLFLIQWDWSPTLFNNLNSDFSFFIFSKIKKKTKLIKKNLITLWFISKQRKRKVKLLKWKATLFFNDSYFFFPITEDFIFFKWTSATKIKIKPKVKWKRGRPRKADIEAAKALASQKKIKVRHRWVFSYRFEKNFFLKFFFISFNPKFFFFFSIFMKLYISRINLPKR